jgi:hypothetical protein
MVSKMTQEVRNAIYELVFVLSQGNAFMSYLGVVNTLIDYVQLVALSFSKVDYIDWKVPGLQQGLTYAVLPWPADELMFFVTFGATVGLNALLLVLFYQAYAKQGVQTVAILQTGRVGMGLFSTVLYFPIIDTFLQHFKYLLSLNLQGQRIFGTEVDYQGRLALCWVAVFLFSIPVYLFTFLCFSPDPLNKEKDLTAKVNTRPESVDLLCRGLMALNFSFNSSAVARVWVQFTLMAFLLFLHLSYPTYAIVWMNYVRAGQFGSLAWVCAMAVYIQAHPVNDNLICIITLSLIPVCWLVFGYLARLRISRVNVCRWLLSQRLDYRQPPHSRNAMWFRELKSHITSFVQEKCLFPIDVEIASRHCLDSLHSDIGRLLFEAGLAKFPKSVYLQCRFAIYLVFIDKPASLHLSDGISHPEDVAHDGPGTSRGQSSPLSADPIDGQQLPQTDIQTDTRLKDDWNEAKRQNRIERLLKKTFAKNPAFDLRYIFFYLVVELEQHFCAQEAGEQELRLLDSIRFKHDSQLARYHHQEALKAKCQFWNSVLVGVEIQLPQTGRDAGKQAEVKDEQAGFIPLEELEKHLGISCVVSDRFYRHFKAAQVFYQSLLTKFPCSRAVSQLYVDFLRHVAQDERGAVDVERHYEAAKQTKRNNLSSEMESEASGSSGGRQSRLYGALLSTIGGSSKGSRRINQTVM